MLHFAAADLEEARGNVEASRKVYEELVAGLLPAEETPTAAEGEAVQIQPEKKGIEVQHTSVSHHAMRAHTHKLLTLVTLLLLMHPMPVLIFKNSLDTTE